MPRCTIRFCQFARSLKDEKELPVRRCSAAQAHLTVASAASVASPLHAGLGFAAWGWP